MIQTSTKEAVALKSISDDELLDSLAALIQQSRRVESELVARIGEVDRRRLYVREATSSMFAYCIEVLILSEHEAYMRISVARASRKYPVLLTMLRDGRLHLSAIAKLAPHLDRLDLVGREQLLECATHKSKRHVEELVASLSAKPDLQRYQSHVVRRCLEPPAQEVRQVDGCRKRRSNGRHGIPPTQARWPGRWRPRRPNASSPDGRCKTMDSKSGRQDQVGPITAQPGLQSGRSP